MRNILTFALLLFAICTNLNGQNLSINIGTANANQGDTANIDITVTNFNALFGAQFSITWDSTKFKFARISNKLSSSVLPGEAEIGTPTPGSTIKQGTITYSWSDVNTASLPNNTRLFTLRLRAVGNQCDSTIIKLSNVPTKSEYYNANFETKIPTSVDGKAKINGTGCSGGGGNSTALTITAAKVVTPPNSTVCVPITVRNFKNIAAAQAKIVWDPTVIRMKPLPVKFDTLSGNQYNGNNIAAGMVNFAWIIPTSIGSSLTIPDNRRMIEICFDAIGPVGSMSNIDIIDSDLETNFSDSNGVELKPIVINDGKVTISDVRNLTLSIDKVTVNQGNLIDVTFKVDNFIDIQSVGFAVTYDPGILTFEGRKNDADPSAVNSNLVQPGRFNYNFLRGNFPLTLPNGSTLFTLSFRANSCTGADKISNILVLDQPSLPVQFVNKDALLVPFTINQGSVTVKCTDGQQPCNISVTSSNNVSCNGKNDGVINVSITNASSNCQAVWKRNGTNFGNPLPISSASLSGLGAGIYSLEVECGTAKLCSTAITITEPTAIQITETITNIGCNVPAGAIDINVTGGVPNYTYSWSNGATSQDISNLIAGNYTVVVTDASSCTTSKSFPIVDSGSTPLSMTPNVTNTKCAEESNGSISLSITGGCTPYKITWAGSTETGTSRTGLSAGTYGVTVTDASNPVKSTNLQVVVGSPDAINITGQITGSSGNNGAIVLNVSGGSGTYTSYSWADGITTKDRSNLAPGDYTVQVTDSNGCKSSKTFNVNNIGSGGDVKISNLKVASEAVNSGFGISCVNLCDGVISGTLEAGTAPYTVAVTGASAKTITVSQVGAFNVTGLCAGDHTVKVTDASGKTFTSQPIKITQPAAISVVQSEVKCAEGALPTGSINIDVTGGALPYTYNWSNGKKTEDLELLQVGTYTVVVRDLNGCESSPIVIRIKDCNQADNCFEEYSTIITPNNDGSNDVFSIACAPQFENSLFIYDRWGNLVYSEKDYKNFWEGKSNSGTDLPEGGYLWVLRVVNSNGTREDFKGAVTILRN